VKTVQIRCLSTVRSNMMDYLIITWCGTTFFSFQINSYCEQNFFIFKGDNCKKNNKIWKINARKNICVQNEHRESPAFLAFLPQLKYTMSISLHKFKFSWNSLAKSKRNAGQFNCFFVLLTILFFQLFL